MHLHQITYYLANNVTANHVDTLYSITKPNVHFTLQICMAKTSVQFNCPVNRYDIMCTIYSGNMYYILKCIRYPVGLMNKSNKNYFVNLYNKHNIEMYFINVHNVDHKDNVNAPQGCEY